MKNERMQQKEEILEIMAEMIYGIQYRRGTKQMQTDRQTEDKGKKVSVPQLSSPKGQNRLCRPPGVYRSQLPCGKAAEA